MRAMLWKEWKQLQAELFARDHWRAGILPALLFVGAFGIFEPWRIGPSWMESPIMLFSFVALLPLTTVATVAPDSFAGERERHTLDTLLTTPLPNYALLIGKIGPAAGYGWTTTLVSMVLGLVTINLLYAQGEILLYSAGLTVGMLGVSLLIALFTATAGVLVSLHAPTVRHAQQSLGAIVLLPLLVPAFLVGPFAPQVWKTGLGQILQAMGAANFTLIFAVSLILLDGILIAITLVRFRRYQLFLD